MPVPLTAHDIPEIRARMTAWTRDPGPDGAANWFRFFMGPQPHGATETRVFDRVDDVGTKITATLAAQLPISELFFVSAEMTELARHAAETLTDYSLHPEDLPSPVGTLVYAVPPVPAADGHHEGASMVTWGPGRGGLWVHRWARTPDSSRNPHLGRTLATLPHQDALARAERAATHPIPTPDTPPTSEAGLDYVLAGLLPNLRRAPIPPSFTGPCGYDWRGLTPMEYTDMHGWPADITPGTPTDDAEAGIALERTILATWLLMGQTLVRSEQLTAPRAARRRITRDDPTLSPAVRYVDLRRARTEPADHGDDATSGRRYRHRWVVRGHWRNQYYASRNDHRPIWIDPHVAGPGDKPLLGGERVNVLRR